jgi:serine/threonine protein kinase/Tfp pilus assembly protein PilF
MSLDGSSSDACLVEDRPTFRLHPSNRLANLSENSAGAAGHSVAQWILDLPAFDPSAAHRLTQALGAMPAIGAPFLGFRLLAELGRGGFARVYLAQQGDVADRRVVLKVAANQGGEAQTLGQLQHPHIVPIYSVHMDDPFQAVCMPFLGRTTFQDVLNEVHAGAVLPTTGSAFVRTIKKTTAATSAGEEPVALRTLNGLRYVEAVVWLCAQLTEGLAHAHERGIVHHDLKPANLLLTDAGQPMLLDFNAAHDTKGQQGAMIALIAGTLAYLAPEQLAAFEGTAAPIDARCDLYAFGIILFELLTGRYPFREQNLTPGAIGARVIEERRDVPRLRHLNPAVSPALEAIVRRCLEPDPGRRYQTARQLLADLQRQRDHRPLLHVSEPSRCERGRKWMRRHPRIVLLLLAGIISGILLTASSVVSLVRGRQLARLELQEQERLEFEQKRGQAVTALDKLQEDVKAVRFFLYTRTNEPEQLAAGITLGNRLLDDYGLLTNARWQESSLVQSLGADRQQEIAETMGEVLLLMARGLFLQQGGGTDQADRTQVLVRAQNMNELAARCDAANMTSPAWWRQRAALSSALGDPAQARDYTAAADRLPLRTARDYYWLASDQIAAGRLRDALPLLEKATHEEPQNFWAWFVLGNCHDRMGRDASAEACYSVCIALRPTFHWAYFNRGLTRLRQQRYPAAIVDFDKALALRPDLTDAYHDRALARKALGQFAQAEEDLTEAIQRGGPSRLYFLRARVREKRGNLQGAQHDLDEGLRRPPGDEKSWLTRGYFLLSRNPLAALADFDQALRLNPLSLDALQNKAHVLAEKLHRNEEALAVLDRSLELCPDSLQVRAGRGIVLARLGRREAALGDARKVLSRDAGAPGHYQVACIYALTSRQESADRFLALQHLSFALNAGYGLDLLESDPDLDPLRTDPEFRRLGEAANGKLNKTAP